MSSVDAIHGHFASTEQEQLVANLVGEFLEASDAGQEPDVDSYLERCSDDLARETFQLSVGTVMVLRQALAGQDAGN